MKKIYNVLMALATATMMFTSCSESNDTFFTASEDDDPRILNTNIPEGAGGGRANLPSITRDNNFKFEVIVTPAEYTTVTWFIDGEQVFEGKTIDYSLIAGKYDVDIVATTTKGKSTKRMCSLEVLPVEGDPALASDAKNLWCQLGTTKTMNVTGFEGVTSMTIGGQALADFQNNGSTVTFSVPAVAEGEQKVVVVKDGKEYGCGNVNISSEEYVDPGVEKFNVFEGEEVINDWGKRFAIPVEDWSAIKPGAVMTITGTIINGTDYANFHILDGAWAKVNDLHDLNWNVEQGGTQTMQITLSEADLNVAVNNGGLGIQGWGWTLNKIVIENPAVPTEIVAFEGEDAADWGKRIALEADWTSVTPGQVLVLTADMVDGAGYASFHLIDASWAKVKEDIAFNYEGGGEQTLELELTEDLITAAIHGGGLGVQGFGFVLKKAVIK